MTYIFSNSFKMSLPWRNKKHTFNKGLKLSSEVQYVELIEYQYQHRSDANLDYYNRAYFVVAVIVSSHLFFDLGVGLSFVIL